jgi:hypothetical protein
VILAAAAALVVSSAFLLVRILDDEEDLARAERLAIRGLTDAQVAAILDRRRSYKA